MYSAAAPATLSRETADALGRLRILYDGRIAPVQTFARDFTLKIYGKPSYRGFSAEQVLAGWIFYPEQWQFERMIRVGQDTVRRSIGSGKTAQEEITGWPECSVFRPIGTILR